MTTNEITVEALISQTQDALAAWTTQIRPNTRHLLHSLSSEFDPESPLQALLVHRILTAFSALDVAERNLALVTGGDHSRRSGDYWERRVAGASRRYLAALKAFATVRATERPPRPSGPHPIRLTQQRQI